VAVSQTPEDSVITVRFHWHDASLLIQNAPPFFKQELQYTHRELKWSEQKYENVVMTQKMELWHEDVDRNLVTYQGFLETLVELCRKTGHPFEVIDERAWFPKPNLKLAGGFRGSQRLMFYQLVCADRSGLYKAPTRYGKSVAIANTIAVYPGLKTVLAAPGADLLSQTVEELQKRLPDRQVKGVFTGSKGKKPSDDITVCSLDSLHKMEPESVRLLLVDEPHAAVSKSRLPELLKFRNARIFGYGATLSGRFDQADKLITGLFGPVLAHKTFREAVAEKVICNIVVWLVEIPFTPQFIRQRLHAYRSLVYESDHFHRTVAEIAREVVPMAWQTLMFVKEADQVDILKRYLPETEVAVAARLTNLERKDLFLRMKEGNVKRCAATDIYSTGVTFPDLRVVINSAGGGGSITGTQKPGRLAQNRPGKEAGYLIDFVFRPTESIDPNNGQMCVVRDCEQRIKVYTENGYDIRRVKHWREIKLT
jgi:superfamily II DNA or RNA helicase